MYSYDDRIRAVALFIKLSKRVRPTIRQLGYPTKNSLKDWYREYEQRLDLPMGLQHPHFCRLPESLTKISVPQQVDISRGNWNQKQKHRQSTKSTIPHRRCTSVPLHTTSR
ncbi:hypothetical protein D5038_14475 [Verminephrobacter aporrectodeae subsp. tuberculatae]|nr:hypothetical protein [Verminephrobacter aporrectodeae subsp. tuberculatae]MCW8207780.1 hypothetical protein [Verminephrobacter aporrectodeae subsp. tuberculatae]